MRKSLKGISEDDQKTIEKKPKYENEGTLIESVIGELKVFENKANELLFYLKNLNLQVNCEVRIRIDSKILTEVNAKFDEIKSLAGTFTNILVQKVLKD